MTELPTAVPKTTADIEAVLHEHLIKHFVDLRAIKGDDLMFDETGLSAFVVVAFNHPIDEKILGEGCEGIDKLVAVGSCSIATMPYVTPDADGMIGPHETNIRGVQAVAAGMLLSSLQQGAVFECMAMAQSAVIKHQKLS